MRVAALESRLIVEFVHHTPAARSMMTLRITSRNSLWYAFSNPTMIVHAWLKSFKCNS